MTAPLVADEQGDVSDVAEIAGTRLDDGNWDIGVSLTDLPSRMERNPVSTEVDPEHRVALISLPALGSRRLRRRVRQTVAGVVRQQATQDEELLDSPSSAVRHPGRSPGTSATRCGGCAATSAWSWAWCAPTAPGRLCTSLSRALAGVFATAAVGFITGMT